MLTKFEIKLSDPENNINRNMASLFHGFIMEQLPLHYVQTLHENGLRPFSQNITTNGDTAKWTICTLNDECSKIFTESIMNMPDVYIKHKNMRFDIISKNINSTTYKNFIDNTYFHKNISRNFIIYFNTPTAFKKDGRYIFFPNLEMIYKNLIRRFDEFSDEYRLYDEEMIESLLENSYISAYKLQSCAFFMESVSIPSFVGRIKVKINGPEQMANLSRLLFKFGEYSGIGIKTTLGMGGVRIEEV